jgi:hypothetical protein
MPAKAKETPTRPNILVIWGDDIGITNLSCYSNGLMGYHTPNIDRLAKEGMMFTDSAGMALVTPFLQSFKEFPPRQNAASFTIDQSLDKMATAGTGPSGAVTKSA